jgi:hypothetical protein
LGLRDTLIDGRSTEQPAQESHGVYDTPAAHSARVTARDRKRPPAAPTPAVPVLLTTTEVARILRRSPDRVRAWRAEGYGPPFVQDEQTGGVWYELAALEAWIASRRVTSW